MKNQKQNLILLSILTLIFVGYFFFESDIRLKLSSAYLIAPYKFNIVSLSENNETIKDFEQKILKDKEGALDRATLASLYAAKAKRTGDETYYDKAYELANESLKLLPFSNATAKMVLAKVAMARHDFQKAIILATEVLKEKAGADSYTVLATSYLAIGDLDNASAFADEAAYKRPGLSTYALRALVLNALGRDEEAEFSFKRAVELEDIGDSDESAWVRCMWGRFYLRQGKLKEAGGLLKEAKRIASDSSLATNLLGEVEMQKKNYPEAAKLFFDAFSTSRQLPYFRNYARAKFAAGDLKVAEEVRGQAEATLRVELSSGKYGHRVELAQLLLDNPTEPNLKEAKELLEVEMKSRSNTDTLKAKLRAEMLSKNFETARLIGERILRTGIRDREVYSSMAQVDNALGNLERSKLYTRLSGNLSSL